MIFILIGFLLLLYMFPASLAMSVTKWSREPRTVMRKVRNKAGTYVKRPVKVQDRLTPAEAITCCIPILSACKVWKALYDKYSWTAFVAPIIPIGIAFRLFVVFTSENTMLYVVSFYVLWICLALHQMLYALVYFITARMHQCGFWTQVLCIVFPEFAAYLLTSRVPRVLREMWEDDGEVGE